MKPSASLLTNCLQCGLKYNKPVYRNPIPVAVGLLPFTTNDSLLPSNTPISSLSRNDVGLLLVQRAIAPCVGEFCLPGGFVDWAESWQAAVAREVREETNIECSPEEFALADTCSTPDGTRVLIFGVSRVLRTKAFLLRRFAASSETSSVRIGLADSKLCFSLHQKVFDAWFAEPLERKNLQFLNE
jgi:ADP-ribose pyrophosphatase YjhB (NUDIX family)